MDVDTVMQRATDLLELEVHGDIVALDIERGQCFGMNGVASRVWELLVNPHSVREITARLVQEYDIDPAVCEREVLNYCQELRSEKLVKLA